MRPQRPQYDSTVNLRRPIQDPTSWVDMPDIDEMDLDYPSTTLSEAEQHEVTVGTLLFAALLGAAGTFVVLWIAPLFGQRRLLPAFVLLGVWIWLLSVWNQERVLFWTTALCSAFLAWLGLYIVNLPFVIFFLAVAFAAFLADQITLHYVYFKTAAPTPKHFADEERRAWRSRFLIPPYRASKTGLNAFYLFQFVLIVVGTPLLVCWSRFLLEQKTSLSLYAGSVSLGLAICYLLLIPLVSEFFAALPLWPRGANHQALAVRHLFFGTVDALRSFATYNLHLAEAPGLFHSPAGDARTRHDLLFVGVALASLGVLPVADYFALPFSRPTPERIDWRAEFSVAPDPDPSSPLQRDHQVKVHAMRVEHLPVDHIAQMLRNWGYDEEEIRKALPDLASLHPYPSEWIFRSILTMVRERDLEQAWVLAYACFAILVGPLACFVAIIFSLSAPYVGRAHQAYVDPTGAFQAQKIPGKCRPMAAAARWEATVSRLLLSKDKSQRNHLYIGRNYWNDAPVIVPAEMLFQHAHITGPSGFGKTTLGLTPLIAQLIRMSARDQDSAKAASVVVFDLKGSTRDRFLFQTVQNEAQSPVIGKPLPFKFFNSRHGFPTHLFNPLLGSRRVTLTPYQRAEFLCQALGLKYGRDYGKDWFGDANGMVAYHVIKNHPDACTFRQLAEHAYTFLMAVGGTTKIPAELRKAGQHIWGVLQRLADLEIINWDPQLEKESYRRAAIDLDDIFDVTKPPQVVYFEFPGTVAGESSGELARLAFYRMLECADAPRPMRPVFAVIDEFQVVAAHNFTRIQELARSSDIALILSNQSSSALTEIDRGLAESVETNTQFKQAFGTNSVVETEHWARRSGQHLERTQSVTSQYNSLGLRTGTSINKSLQLGDRYNTADLQEMTARENRNIVQFSRHKGYARYAGQSLVIESDFMVSKEAYEHLRDQEPPLPPPGAVIAGQFQASQTANDATRKNVPTTPQIDRQVEILQEEFEDVTDRRQT